MPNPHKWAKPTNFPKCLHTSLSEETGTALEKVGEPAGWSDLMAARECIVAGLPVVRERLRSRMRAAKRQASGNGAAK